MKLLIITIVKIHTLILAVSLSLYDSLCPLFNKPDSDSQHVRIDSMTGVLNSGP